MKTILNAIYFISVSFMITSISSATANTHLSVMTFNIENGGTQVSFAKVIEAVKRSGADIVGIQEAWGNTCRMAKEIGWKYCDTRQHIISRFPLFETMDSEGIYVLVEVTPGKFVAMGNMHLPDEPYGPELIKMGATADDVIKNERKVRLPTALPFIEKMALLAQQGVPVFLTGDFNSPSHLDWTRLTVNKLQNHRYELSWPVTKTLENKGFIDSYRKINTDPVKNPAYTWPSSRPQLKNAMDGFNPSEHDLPDRVDFIFTGGHSTVIDSQIVGEKTTSNNNIVVSPWPSDHRAVVSRLVVTPVSYPTRALKPVLHENIVQHAPEILLTKKVFHPGEAIQISWAHAPQNRFDYIAVTPVGQVQKLYDNTIYLYTHAKSSGTLKYSAENARGNWLAWNKNEKATWPLAPGLYEIKLMLDDGLTMLASARIRVKS